MVVSCPRLISQMKESDADVDVNQVRDVDANVFPDTVAIAESDVHQVQVADVVARQVVQVADVPIKKPILLLNSNPERLHEGEGYNLFPLC